MLSAVSFAAVADAVYGNSGFVKENAVIANTETEQAFELATERLNTAFASPGVAVNGFEDLEGGLLFNGTDFGLHVRPEANLLQAASIYFANLLHG